MDNYRKIRLYFDRWNNRLLDARGLPVKRLEATRNDLVQLEVQVFDGGQFAVDSSGYVLAANATDLSAFTGSTFALKTSANYLNDGDFSMTVAGFDTANPVHLPASGRVAVLAGLAVAAGDYYVELELRTAAGNSFSLPPSPLVLSVYRDVVLGTEATLPAGTTVPVNGNTAIADEAVATAAIAVTGMTATGQVILGVLAPTGTPTEAIYWTTYAAGSFTIHSSVAPGTGNAYNFRWTLVRLA
jgi:hypothetical protein